MDVIAHNLLNCFGEIEVNFSMNATSSGRIGVASSVTTFKKQEKLEIVAYAKKQEEFMMDANLVCIKLASSHPFIFIRLKSLKNLKKNYLTVKPCSNETRLDEAQK